MVSMWTCPASGGYTAKFRIQKSMEKNAHPAAFTGKRPWTAVFDFSWLVYPSGELPNTVFLHIFSCEPHEHPFQSAPWCRVTCLNSRNSLQAPGSSAKTVLSGAAWPHPLPAQLAAQPQGLRLWAAFRASGHHHRTLLRAGGERGFPRRAELRVRFLQTAAPSRQDASLNCMQRIWVTSGVSAVHTTGKDSPKRDHSDHITTWAE